MAVRDDFAAGEVLAAADLNDTFASKLDNLLTTTGDLVVYGATDPARLAIGTDGQVLTADSGELRGMKWDDAPFGKIQQVVRATDATLRSTTSTSFVDVTGMSVTITPTKTTSAILIIANVDVRTAAGTNSAALAQLQITDSSNNPISGAEDSDIGFILVSTDSKTAHSVTTLFAYATPATTSAVTYKLRFSASSGATANIRNDNKTGQIFAIEVGA